MENSIGEAATGTRNHSLADREALPVESGQPQLASPDNLKLEHNHKKLYFGRRMEGCPKCESMPPHPVKHRRIQSSNNAPPRTQLPDPSYRPDPSYSHKPVAPPVAPPGGVYLTFAELQALMAGNTDALKDFARELGTELRRPDPEEEAAKAAAADRKAKNRISRLAEIQALEDGKAQSQANCPHTNEKGRTLIYRGQVYSDGCYHPMCHRCQKTFTLIPISVADMAGVT